LFKAVPVHINFLLVVGVVMAEIKVLIEGYAKQVKGGWIASSTVTLIKSNGKNIIVDPGCNRKKLFEVLKKEKLSVSDIDFVILTHAHADHTLLCGIFDKARVLNAVEIYDNDRQVEYGNFVPDTDVEIIQTPGHCVEHCSVLISTEKGTVVVAGDVFWWVESEKQIVDVEKVDDAHPLETNMVELIKSRKKIIAVAEFIIPGHGKMFKAQKKVCQG